IRGNDQYTVTGRRFSRTRTGVISSCFTNTSTVTVVSAWGPAIRRAGPRWSPNSYSKAVNRPHGVYMQPADLNLTTQVTGHGRFLFVHLPQGAADTEFAVALDRLGASMENIYDVEGQPSADALRRGCFQFLRAEPALSSARDLPHPSMIAAHFLVYLEG